MYKLVLDSTGLDSLITKVDTPEEAVKILERITKPDNLWKRIKGFLFGTSEYLTMLDTTNDCVYIFRREDITRIHCYKIVDREGE